MSSTSSAIDLVSARRCWSTIDAGSSGLVTATDLQRYLTKFVDEHSQSREDGACKMEECDEEEQKRGASPSAAAAASSSAAAAASTAVRPIDTDADIIASRARDLCQRARLVSQADLDDLVLFCDVDADGRLELDDLLRAYRSFCEPPVALTNERFESNILEKGMAGARPPASASTVGVVPPLETIFAPALPAAAPSIFSPVATSQTSATQNATSTAAAATPAPTSSVDVITIDDDCEIFE